MDQRLIRTAVLGGPDSLEPVIMPTVYEVAMGLRLTHHGETFWCGTWLGGCGSQIMTKIGRRKVPHFAHYPEMAEKCRRVDLDETRRTGWRGKESLCNHLGCSALSDSKAPAPGCCSTGETRSE